MALYCRQEGVLSQSIEGEAVLYDTKNERYFSLNEAGTLLWEGLQQPTSLEQLQDKLFEVYEVSRETLETDICELLESLEQAGLIILSET